MLLKYLQHPASFFVDTIGGTVVASETLSGLSLSACAYLRAMAQPRRFRDTVLAKIQFLT
jgi:hypothetical protein